MAVLVINGKPVEADLGEGLLTVARRNRAHIGFVCDGNGLCTTCECRVQAGAENLSEPNAIERNWLPQHRLDKGYRLSCQTTILGPGPIRVITRAEELRLLWNSVVDAPAGTNSGDNLTRFYGYVVQLNVDHLSMFPLNLLRTVNRLGIVRTLLPVQDNDQYFRDIGRVIDERTGTTFSDASLASDEEVEVKVKVDDSGEVRVKVSES